MKVGVVSPTAVVVMVYVWKVRVCFARTLSRKTIIEVSLPKRNQSFMEHGTFGAL